MARNYIEIKAEDEPFAVRIFELEHVLHLTADAIRDIADQIEDEAKLEAPVGETGALKAHPVDVTHNAILRPGEHIDTRSFSFGGGFSARGGNPLNRGQFSRGRLAGVADDFEEIEITVAEEPKYAKWVHNGTGMYGTPPHLIVPRTAKFLKFTYHGINYLLPSVYGQQANPYLERAFLYVNRTYIPTRIEKLRIDIRATT